MKKQITLIALIAVGAGLLSAQEVSLKLNEEFETKIEMSFKSRPSRDVNTVNLTGEKRAGGPISYLAIAFKLLKSNDEKRIRIIQGGSTKTRKIEINEIIKLDMGFIEDIKSKEKPHEITLILLTEKKEPVSKVVMVIEDDGTFLVNGERRGKF